MRSSVKEVHQLVSTLEPADERGVADREWTLRWLASTDDIWRRVKPATPSPHLVSYAVVVDPADGSVLLVDHVNARRWLPTGGHVEIDEHPADAAAREVREELGIDAVFNDPERRPSFLTVTDVGDHTDVSLWFVLEGWRGMPVLDRSGEFAQVRWWTRAEIARGGVFDPEFGRFLRTGARFLGEVEFTGIPQERHAEVSDGIRRLER
ncbi:NUDIX domain-containing protein [Kribbella sp. NPDC051770]|uniref:NUDIX hydrolase n=1 Tax=Kribbella sp. NPDC051770 TaxID=3155413 RepID=UPI00342051B3